MSIGGVEVVLALQEEKKNRTVLMHCQAKAVLADPNTSGPAPSPPQTALPTLRKSDKLN